jgi:hypothetical protein
LGVSASEIAQCDSIKGYSLKSKKILGTKAGTYESLKSQPLVSACFITGIKSKLAERVSANCMSLSIVYTGYFIYIKQLDKESFCLVRSIRTHQDSAESRFVSKTHSKT